MFSLIQVCQNIKSVIFHPLFVVLLLFCSLSNCQLLKKNNLKLNKTVNSHIKYKTRTQYNTGADYIYKHTCINTRVK